MSTTSVLNPEAWMPEAGLNKLHCVKAASIMAELCVLVYLDPEKTETEVVEAQNFLAYVGRLSCDESDLEQCLGIDLRRAGLGYQTAQMWSSYLASDAVQEEVAGARFFNVHDPSRGLINRISVKGRRARSIDDAKLVKHLLEMGDR